MLLTRESVLQERLRVKQEILKRKTAPIRRYIPSHDLGHDQLSFHKSTAFIRLGTGGNQSGKSVMGAAEDAWELLGNNPYKPNTKPGKIYCISAEYRTLYEGVWRHLRPDGPDYGGMGFIPQERVHKIGPKVTGTDLPSFIEVKWGEPDEKGKYKISRLDFISAEGGKKSRKRVQSAACTLIHSDEEVDQNVFDELIVRTLATDGNIIITATLVDSLEYLLELEDRAESGDEDVFLTRLDTNRNKFISEEQKKRVTRNLSKGEAEVRLQGMSRRSKGLVYSNFKNHNIVEPFQIPPNWPKLNGLDPGFRVFAGLWAAIDPHRPLMYIYDEMRLEQITSLQQVATEIETKGPVELRIIDPAAKQKLVTGEEGVLVQLAAKYGIYCIPGNNNVDEGIFTVKDLLNIDPTLGVPTIRVFSTCTELLRERRVYRLIPKKDTKDVNQSPDKPLKRNDHLMDCLRYITMYATLEYLVRQIIKPEETIVQRHLKRMKEKRRPHHHILGSEF